MKTNKLKEVVFEIAIPKEEEEIIETSIRDEIEKEIQLCQSDYDPKKYTNISREQFNKLCVCYINGLVEIYDEKEAKHQAKYNKPSDNFVSKEEEIIKYCASKIK